MSKFRLNNRSQNKLNEAQVREMRERYQSGRVTHGQLSRDYHVSVTQIGRILRGEVWQNVAPAPPSTGELQESAERMMAVQQAMLMDNLQQDIEREKELDQRGDKLLAELRGEKDDKQQQRQPASEDADSGSSGAIPSAYRKLDTEGS